MSDILRLFVALELPTHVRQALEAVQDDLRARLPGKALRWVRPSGIHLTLKFLGDVPGGQADAVADGVRAAAVARAPFQLRAEGLGVFPNPRRARVLWVGVKGDLEALGELQASVEEHIVPLGYPRESRPFSAHLTLARLARNATRAEREAAGALPGQGDLTLLSGAEWRVDSVCLIRSQLKPSGAVYTHLAEARLAGEG